MVTWENVACFLRVNTVIFRNSYEIYTSLMPYFHVVVTSAVHFGEKQFYENIKSLKIVLRVIFSDLFFACGVRLLYLSCMYRQCSERKTRSNAFLKTSKITFLCIKLLQF